MFCPKCNKMLNGTPKFCPGCGTSLASAQPPQPQPPQPQPPQPQPPQYGQPQYGQPQYQQPQYQQPQYGQPQYGQPQYQQPQYGQPQYGAPYGGYRAANPNAGGSTLLGLVVYVAILAVSLIGVYLFDFLTISIEYEGLKESNGVSLSEMRDLTQEVLDVMDSGYAGFYNIEEMEEATIGLDLLCVLFIGGAILFTVLTVLFVFLALTKLGRNEYKDIWKKLGCASVMAMICQFSPIILGSLCLRIYKELTESIYGYEISKYYSYSVGIWPIILCVVSLVLAIAAFGMMRKCQ